MIRAVLEKQRFQAWIDDARTRMTVKTNVPALEKLAPPPAAVPNRTGGASGQP